MKTPYLIQRLTRPILFSDEERSKSVKFPVGAGKSGNNEARKLVKFFCVHDYMGSAEFEFGTVPSFYERMARLATDDLLDRWRLDLARPVYVIGRGSDRSLINEYIVGIAENKYRLKERSRFLDTNSAVGWLDIENDYAFFVDKKMYIHFARYWGVNWGHK